MIQKRNSARCLPATDILFAAWPVARSMGGALRAMSDGSRQQRIQISCRGLSGAASRFMVPGG